MRKQFFLLSVLLITLGFIHWGCNKDNPETITYPPSLPVEINTAPLVNVGQDHLIVLPATSLILSGVVTDAERNIKTYAWKQVSGQVAAHIERPDSLTTKVSNFAKGSYEFELTATDSKGLFDKDTQVVTVYDQNIPGQGVAFFSGLSWQCPMGCWLEISCLSCSIPPNTPYKVYVNEGQTNVWVEAVPQAQWTINLKYSYTTEKDKLWVYVNDEPSTIPYVKIVY